jgi:hypothetical protein
VRVRVYAFARDSIHPGELAATSIEDRWYQAWYRINRYTNHARDRSATSVRSDLETTLATPPTLDHSILATCLAGVLALGLIGCDHDQPFGGRRMVSKLEATASCQD